MIGNDFSLIVCILKLLTGGSCSILYVFPVSYILFLSGYYRYIFPYICFHLPIRTVLKFTANFLSLYPCCLAHGWANKSGSINVSWMMKRMKVTIFLSIRWLLNNDSVMIHYNKHKPFHFYLQYREKHLVLFFSLTLFWFMKNHSTDCFKLSGITYWHYNF